MNLEVFRPGPVLVDYIRCYWTLQFNGPDFIQRLFPLGEPQMIFHLGKTFKEFVTPDALYSQPQALICGHITSFKDISAGPGTELFAISFQPHALRSILNVPANHFTDRSIDLLSIDTEYKYLHERLLEAADTMERIKMLEKHFSKMLANSNLRNHQMIGEVVTSFNHDPSMQLSNSAISGMSQRHIERLFLEHVGMSARSFQKISRLGNALRFIASSASLTEVGYESGYFDQAHFSRSFKELTGYTPKRYRQEIIDST